jgi:hypothetical protein
VALSAQSKNAELLNRQRRYHLRGGIDTMVPSPIADEAGDIGKTGGYARPVQRSPEC